eukprot:TRINITY_DN4509_c0_g2_i2.p1 TRINITY_DN4509_c0_g2~~TRINITY_DN4509_c0_g2_i2.p1  ORF type:complete len:455 (-),score=9.67 TRINITY_DN4509_c0_g2_i2:47-1411(-)
MMRLLWIGFLAVALAAFNQQTGPLDITDLADGDSIFKTLGPTSESSLYDLQLFRFWVPENTKQVLLTMTFVNDECDELVGLVNTYSFPCSPTTYNETSQLRYMCAKNFPTKLRAEDVFGTQEFLTAYFQYNLFHFAVNRYWYIAVGKNSPSNYADTCNYTLTMESVDPCSEGQIALPGNIETGIFCRPYVDLSPELTGAYPVWGLLLANIDGADDWMVFRLEILPETAYISIDIASTANDTHLYARSYAGATEMVNSCDRSGVQTTDGLMNYYNFTCWAPRAGSFFVSLHSTTRGYDVSYNFRAKICDPGTGGHNCTDSVRNATDLVPGTVNVPGFDPPLIDLYEAPAVFYALDIPEEGPGYLSGQNVRISASSTDESLLWIRRNGFPLWSEGMEGDWQSWYLHDGMPFSFGSNDFDWNVPGRIYFGLTCLRELGRRNSANWYRNFGIRYALVV